jgi:hypothetical protein
MAQSTPGLPLAATLSATLLLGAPAFAKAAPATMRPSSTALAAPPQNGIPAPPGWQWRYRKARRAVDRERRRLGKAYQAAQTLQAKQQVLRKASQRVVQLIRRKLFPFWIGTPWSYRGSTTQPRRGSIACGTFVATVLAHAGFNVDHYRLGALNSPQLMKTLTTAKYMKLTYAYPIKRFLRVVRRMGNGLFIVGLDMHVGFLLVRGHRVWFVHSNYDNPGHVVSERAETSAVLTASRYRLVGRISQDLRLMEAWIHGQPLPTYRRRLTVKWEYPKQ